MARNTVLLLRRRVQCPEGFAEFFAFLCHKYRMDPEQVFLEYESGPPPRLKGGEHGYYDGLLSHRVRNGKQEFLITVFRIARNPLLTLAHEFAPMMDDLARGRPGESLGLPNEVLEREFDRRAMRDLEEFLSQGTD